MNYDHASIRPQNICSVCWFHLDSMRNLVGWNLVGCESMWAYAAQGSIMHDQRG